MPPEAPTTCPSAPTPRSSAGQRRRGRRDVPGTADDSPDYDDGLPVVFTWPVLGSTVHPEDFLFTLTNGDQVVPNSAGLVPNWELNERNTVVVFGDFGNRGAPGEADAVYPAKLEIVDDGTPLRFLGPDGEERRRTHLGGQGATGYGTGPQLVGAKLNHVGDAPAGEGGAPVFERALLPNDEFALYGGGDFRLRMLTSGGFTPTGSPGSPPTPTNTTSECSDRRGRFDRPALRDRGRLQVAGGTLRVLGLADLGQPLGDGVVYDDCYAEDVDNQIDIILEGDDAAARSITTSKCHRAATISRSTTPEDLVRSRSQGCATASRAPMTSNRSSSPSMTHSG